MEKILIIYIDIDDDLGRIGIKTPVIGGCEAYKAIKIAEEKIPTDSDLNTMIVAYNIFKKMHDNGQDVEIAFISGSEGSSLESQLEFSRKLDEVIKKVNPSRAIVVYDSPEDAKAIPIIQSRLPIAGIERVLVEQYRGVEETYVLLGRYIKKALSEPRFSRIFLGVPGIILFILGLFSLLNLTAYAGPIIMMVVATALIIRGLGIDDLIENWWENSTIMVIVSIIALIAVIAGIINGYFVFIGLKSYDAVTELQVLLSISPYIVFASVVLFGGKAVNRIIAKDVKVWHDIFRIFSTVIIYYIIVIVARNLEENPAEVGLQTIYSLSITTLVLISIYILMNIIEKYKFNPTSATS
ncbi:DUF373 family protein [Stygiolobus caldivivus]|nr:DUF373 family protein [Stygiolobus caldivivus]